MHGLFLEVRVQSWLVTGAIYKIEQVYPFVLCKQRQQHKCDYLRMHRLSGACMCRLKTIKQTGATGCILTPVYASAPGSGQLGKAPISFLAPDNTYAVGQEPGAAAQELKQVVQGFHEAGLEVILQARSSCCLGLAKAAHVLLPTGYWTPYLGLESKESHGTVRHAILLLIMLYIMPGR